MYQGKLLDFLVKDLPVQREVSYDVDLLNSLTKN